MEIAGFNLLDLVVVAVILLSGIFALARGFVKEVLSIVSWVGAAFATFYGFHAVSAFVHRFIESPMIGDAVAAGSLFLLTLFALSFVSGLIANRVRGSSVGSVDRSLGFVFGLLRGFVLISIAYLALSWALPPAEQPTWVRAAKTMPLLQRGAAVLTALAPASFGESQPASRPANERPARGAQGKPPANPLTAGGGPGYKVEERKDMDRLIQGTQ
jgi:membrane protein required for colicin V production